MRAELLLEPLPLHARAAPLEGVEEVDAEADEVGDDAPAGAVVVVESDGPGLVGQVDHPLHAGEKELADVADRDHEIGLAAHVLGDVGDVDLPRHGLVDADGAVVGQAEELVQAVMGDVRVLDEVDEGLLHAPELLVDEEGLGAAAPDGVPGGPGGLGRDAPEVPPVGRRPGVVTLDLGHALEAGQREVDALAVFPRAVVDAPEAAAELVPHPGQARAGVVRLEPDLVVDAEGVQHPASGPATEMPHELAVELHSGPVVGRDAVGPLPREQGPPALPGGHRVSGHREAQFLCRSLCMILRISCRRSWAGRSVSFLFMNSSFSACSMAAA